MMAALIMSSALAMSSLVMLRGGMKLCSRKVRIRVSSVIYWAGKNEGERGGTGRTHRMVS